MISEKIEKIKELKKGNKEIAMFYMPGLGISYDWQVMVGNRSDFVMLGEIDGELNTEGETLSSALDNMIAKLKDEQDQA